MSSDGAMAAKARAMFGERLNADAYAALLQKKSLAEIVAYLKTNTLYKHALEGVNEKAIHRGQLEVLLRRSMYERLQKLLRYGSDADGKFLVAAVMTTEIEMILRCIRVLMNPESDERAEMIAEMPMYISHYMSFDIGKLAEITSYDDLLAFLKNTRYYDILRRYRKDNLMEIDAISLEHDLRDAYYQHMIVLANSDTRGDERQQVLKLVSMRAELEAVSIIYRLKKYFQAAPAVIERTVVIRSCLFKEAEIRRMIKEDTADEVLAALRRKYHFYTKGANPQNIDRYIERIVYNIYYTMIETDTRSNLILLSYMNLSQIEIHNVINICEGVRYHISNDRIRALLVY